MAGLKSGRIRTIEDATAAFTYDAMRIGRKFAAETTADDAPDEVLDSLRLLALDITPPDVVVRIGMTTASGDHRVLTFPVEVARWR